MNKDAYKRIEDIVKDVATYRDKILHKTKDGEPLKILEKDELDDIQK